MKLSALACQSQWDAEPDSGDFDLISGFAFFVEAAALDVVYYRNREVCHLQTEMQRPFITPLTPLILRGGLSEVGIIV